MPRDNFGREREFRERSAIEFNRLNWKPIRKSRFPRQEVVTSARVGRNDLPEQASFEKTFFCTNCGQTITTTSEDRTRRTRVTCPQCNQMYKLHPSYATHGGETIQYEE